VLKEKVGDLRGVFVLDEGFQEDSIVYIAVVILFTVFFIVSGVLQPLSLLRINLPEDKESSLVETSKNGIVNDSEAHLRHLAWIGTRFNESIDSCQVIPFDCDAQSGVSFGVDLVGISVEGEKQVDDIDAAVKRSSHESSLFGVFGDRLVYDLRVGLQDLADVYEIFPLNMIVE
jgi:hypothetical protein